MSGNGAPEDSGKIHINVVDRRHHARGEEAPGSATDRSPYPTIVEELKARAEAAEKRAREVIRATEAELEAVRARLQGDVERRVALRRAALLGALLEVLDNLDRAAGAAARESEAVGRGIDLIRQQMLSLLRAQDVEPVETLDRPFDPHVAEAVATEPVASERDGLVIEELQRGYRLGETILRPARVKVGRAAPGAGGAAEA